MKLLLIALTLLAAGACSQQPKPEDDGKKPAIEVPVILREGIHVVHGGEELFASAYMDETHDAVYHFRKCMFNELFTFYKVGASYNKMSIMVNPTDKPGVVINSAESSDNIGPFWIKGYMFAGGNHSWREGGRIKTAKTISWTAYADGEPISKGFDKVVKELVIVVDNEIYNPATEPESGAGMLSSVMAKERMTYTVNGNSLKVKGEHEFLVDADIHRYYGMQSMFENETAILTPGGGLSQWTAKPSQDVEVKKEDYPDLNLFLERHEKNYYQSCYLYPSGMGNHALVSAGSPTFIFGSYGKSYQVLVSDNKIAAGTKTLWEGIYTWCVCPLADRNSIFCHEGFVGTRRAVHVSCLGAADEKVGVKGVSEGTKIEVFDSRGEVSIEPGANNIQVKSSGPAYAIILL